MSDILNKVLITGNLTRDPEVRYSADGTPICSFSLASNNGWGDNKTVSFFDVVVFKKQAEFVAQYVVKGSSVLVDGRLQQNRWEDKDTGAKRSKVEIIANSVKFVGKKSDNDNSSSDPRDEVRPQANNDDEVPF